MSGQAEFAYREEDNGQFEAPSAGGWEQPGLDIEITDLSIDNNRTRNRQPDDTTPDRSRVGNFVGEMSLSWTMTDSNWHALLPLDSSSLSGSARLADTAQVYVNTTAFDTSSPVASFSQAVVFAGCALQSAEIEYTEGEPITINATIGLGDLIADPGVSSITQPNADQVYAHHGTSLTVDGVTQAGLQSATLSMDNLARRAEQQDRIARAWKVGEIETEFTTDAEFTEVDQLQAATGGSDATSVADFLSSLGSASFTLENGQSTTTTYTLSNLDPANYSWNDIVNPSTDHSEEITYHVADVSV